MRTLLQTSLAVLALSCFARADDPIAGFAVNDLPDGGSAHFAETITQIRQHNPGCRVEVPELGRIRPLRR